MVNTSGGGVNTFAKTHLSRLQFPQVTTRRDVEGSFHLFKKSKSDRYVVIIGHDLQQAIGLEILNSQQAFEWMGITAPMTKIGHWNNKLVTNFWETKKETSKETFAVKIINSVYKILDPSEVAQIQTHLLDQQRIPLFHVLKTKTQLFKAEPSHWTNPPSQH